ncbi:MAG: hypothetical protein EOO75_12310, partial [Myxococcales bacterium]
AGTGGAGGGAAGSAPFEPGEPLSTPADDKWHWSPIEGMKCADGSGTGIRVSRSSKSSKLVVFLAGGGACWNQATCALGTADNLDGYSGAGDGPKGGIFNRADKANPFRDYSYVFVPYCTGDVHTGSNPKGVSNLQFVGYDNMGKALERIVPTFEDPEQVVLTGSSAGGFGALFNYHRTAQAFGDTPVHLIDDAGPPLAPEFYTPKLQQEMLGAWNSEQNLPQDVCPDVKIGSVDEIYGCLAKNHPGRRLGLVSSLQDKTISQFFMISQAKYGQGMAALSKDLDGYPSWWYYLIAGNAHTFLTKGLLIDGTETAGTNLKAWLTDFESGTGSKKRIKPTP